MSKVQLGRDLGPAIDIGPATSRKIMKSNGQDMYETSMRSLNSEESVSPDFGIQIDEKCGPPIAEADFKDDPYFADF
jgi:hypothetical protein